MRAKETAINYTRTRELVNELNKKFGLSVNGQSDRDKLRKGIKEYCSKYILYKEAPGEDSHLKYAFGEEVYGKIYADALRKGEKKEINLWEATQSVAGPKSNSDHIFTDEQKRCLLEYVPFLEYLENNFGDTATENLREYRRYKQKAEEMNAAYREWLANRDDSKSSDSDPTPYRTESEMHFYEVGIMIEALFLEHFTPLDKEALRCDIDTYDFYSGTGYHNVNSAMACERLARVHDGVYYKRNSKEEQKPKEKQKPSKQK